MNEMLTGRIRLQAEIVTGYLVPYWCGNCGDKRDEWQKQPEPIKQSCPVCGAGWEEEVIKMFWFREILGFIWALPVTLIGMLLLIICRYKGSPPVVRYKGLRWYIEPYSIWFLREGSKAMCLGSLVLCQTMLIRRQEIALPRGLAVHPDHQATVDHVDEHRRQCYILGLFIIPLYLILFALAWILYRKGHRANWLEICARWRAGQGLEP
jgi:hypothetical protein